MYDSAYKWIGGPEEDWPMLLLACGGMGAITGASMPE